ncbi:MFS transporter [Actinosynnema mirum]|uniref:Major facilitator superfamily MFS_1 n=1 Tax=Actinosynnema mirum (strain ATCC 29888 / DSM 43827 / JCM 3225 / NBRC 14064 / NCIMB 13271 / NRRL B-12336 / IMRU 3971 / 101) TaxID=446462 RepID=C6WEL0_ACTMD|nr:MFS transporter [Actinosynnema mirum]ACU37810.1 major facilitator superfamily MFS_1 [Actinosynnema mirum DSM 43827]
MTATQSIPPPARTSPPRRDIVRWQLGSATSGVPQAAAPIAFGLLALPLTGTAESGAALVFAMTAAQVLGSVPLSRLGRRFSPVRYLRALVAVRTAAFAAATGLGAVGAPFAALVAAVVVAGAVSGAAHGYQRLLLNHLVSPGRLPRALGVAATLNEVTFALSPVLASLVGSASPVWAMAMITVLGLGPAVLTPRVPDMRAVPDAAPDAAPDAVPDATPAGGGLPREALVWLCCAAAGSGAVAAVEVGAVSFALAFDLGPGWAFLFASVLCAGSVLGGIRVSVRNRVPSTAAVAGYLAASTAGACATLAGGHLVVTLAGAAVLGFFLPLLGTFYSLALDALAPPHRKAEVFALQRVAGAVGVISVSGLLALLGLRAALIGGATLLLAATCLVALRAALPRFRPLGTEPGPLGG